MVKNHLKRINAPKRWNILRKNYKFISRPNPGRDLSLSISLNTVLKEMLNKTKTTKETKYLLKNQGVMVNGVKRYDDKFPVGFLDVVSFPSTKEYFRILIDKKNKMFVLSIKEDESKLKLSKLIDKKDLSKEKVQFNCSDGRNFIVKRGDKLLADAKTNDSLLYAIPENKITQVLKLEKGALVYLYKGKHVGLIVVVDDFKEGNIVFKEGKDVFETKSEYAFAVGKGKPVITIPQEK
ncbi:MAG: hypothetical protein KKF46_03310 [Nanoarchaeota archaeon]|nr:hypothetical protein [Nanoarchaeota archaeon]MBU1321362.1 hypothetical protein [Nanoarchaeota archaeon]MBU1597354.1 hypothetical protein [Nanoarchaeota archaeon]MBU2441269.1 hypothetical protein [Nanoarchaeota archaeon]